MALINSLLFDIAKCNDFTSLIKTSNVCHPCDEIVDFQRKQTPNGPFQLPEPWSGDILNAPILVISSNPSYSKNELFPDLSWPDPMIADFFINRFKDRGIEYSWVHNNKVLNKDGGRDKSVAYWTKIKKHVDKLLGSNSKPGIDYCITELCHCKSTNQIGVDCALSYCMNKFCHRIINLSRPKLIIAIGAKVRDCFNLKESTNGIPIIYLPHPNARQKQGIENYYSEEQINKLRKLLKSAKAASKRTYNCIKLPTEQEVRDFIDKKLKEYAQ